MSLSRRRFVVGAAALAAAATAPGCLLSSGPRPGHRPEHVVLVDWDGLDPAYLDRAPTPNLDALAERGSLSVAEGVFPSHSNPSRASMATGAYPEAHSNLAYYYDRRSGRVVGPNRSLAAASVAEALTSADRTVAAVQWYTVQDRGTSFGDPERLYVEPGGLFGARVDAAVEILNRRPVDFGGRTVTVPRIPDFLAVYGSDLDDAGHAEGPDGPNIAPLVAELDRQLGRLVRATRDAGVHDGTAFIVTGDHGMTAWEGDGTPDLLAAITAAGYVPEAVAPASAPQPATEAVVVPAGRIATIALLRRAATTTGRRQIRAALETVPIVATVLDDDDLAVVRAGTTLGDLVVEATAPWGFAAPGESGGGTRGAHGSTEEMLVPLLLSGAGIRPGVVPRNPRLVDMAPTVCALLSVRAPADAQGRVLSESLGL